MPSAAFTAFLIGMLLLVASTMPSLLFLAGVIAIGYGLGRLGSHRRLRKYNPNKLTLGDAARMIKEINNERYR